MAIKTIPTWQQDIVADIQVTGGPEAARAAKRLVRVGPRDEETTEVAAGLRAGAEGQEGLRAFLEKRPAAWRA